MKSKIRVGIFLFNEVEVLDFAGPFEVFSLAASTNTALCDVLTIGESGSPIKARNGLLVQPATTLHTHPDLDVLILPGGYGAEEIEIKNKTILEWITRQSQHVKILASVCTGAFLLAECGLLNGKKATTHWMDIDRLTAEYPAIEVVRETRFVDEGQLLTSGGISAGIDMSFHIVRRLFGNEVAEQTAKRMEYRL
ncbi:MAG: DJ-1/PfpI family protein [Cyclobacteriaceae bacterium]|nr:DJ-1/PfpI family protein [Cyclobacteriaceae bacterium]